MSKNKEVLKEEQKSLAKALNKLQKKLNKITVEKVPPEVKQLTAEIDKINKRMNEIEEQIVPSVNDIPEEKIEQLKNQVKAIKGMRRLLDRGIDVECVVKCYCYTTEDGVETDDWDVEDVQARFHNAPIVRDASKLIKNFIKEIDILCDKYEIERGDLFDVVDPEMVIDF